MRQFFIGVVGQVVERVACVVDCQNQFVGHIMFLHQVVELGKGAGKADVGIAHTLVYQTDEEVAQLGITLVYGFVATDDGFQLTVNVVGTFLIATHRLCSIVVG